MKYMQKRKFWPTYVHMFPYNNLAYVNTYWCTMMEGLRVIITRSWAFLTYRGCICEHYTLENWTDSLPVNDTLQDFKLPKLIPLYFTPVVDSSCDKLDIRIKCKSYTWDWIKILKMMLSKLGVQQQILINVFIGIQFITRHLCTNVTVIYADRYMDYTEQHKSCFIFSMCLNLVHLDSRLASA